MDSETQQESDLAQEYVAQLNPLQLHALRIAKEDLKSSFSLEKSIGFINWKARR
jgi:hypothetical protein